MAISIPGEVDDVLGSAIANANQAFAISVTLDAGDYPIGSVVTVSATGDAGSVANAVLVISETK